MLKPLPDSQRNDLCDVQHLTSAIHRLGLALPEPSLSASCVETKLVMDGVDISNRFVVCAHVGNDALADGLPSKLTYERYRRWGAGRYGVLISEPVAVHANVRGNASQMHLGSKQDPGLGQLVQCIQQASEQAAVPKPLCVLLLDGSTLAVFRKSHDYLAKVLSRVMEASWDGIQLDVPLTILKDETPSGVGLVGSFLEWVQASFPSLWVAVRMCIYEADADGGGFGAAAQDYRRPDPTIPIAMVKEWSRKGLGLLEIQMTYPPSDVERDILSAPIPEDLLPHEHPLVALTRTWSVVQSCKAAVPDMKLMAGGFSWLRELLPHFAGAWIEQGALDLIALRRFALAYPHAPKDWHMKKQLDPAACCTQCGACTQLSDMEAPVGCVLHHAEVYGPILRQHMRYQAQRIESEALRCHQCYPAPCAAATPGALPIPDMMQAITVGDMDQAGAILRGRQHLAEMCALLSPYQASGEAACVETIFSGRAVAIRDVQYAVAVYARSHARVVVPDVPANKRVVVIGGGPAGLAATVELLRAGVHVLLVERAARIGGVPALLIPESRFSGNAAELDVMFRDALRQDRLRISLNREVRDADLLRKLHADADAVLLATGLWCDMRSLPDEPPTGVWGGLQFLSEVKCSKLAVTAQRAAILAGGDCAMDAAGLLREAGVEQIFMLYPESRAEVPWQMDDRWIAQSGVDLLTWCRPVTYVQDTAGRLVGLHVAHIDPASHAQTAEMMLEVDLLVDAAGVVPDACFQTAWPELACDENGCVTDHGAGVYGTRYQGLFAVGAIRNGGASIPQCVQEGTEAGREIADWLKKQ